MLQGALACLCHPLARQRPLMQSTAATLPTLCPGPALACHLHPTFSLTFPGDAETSQGLQCPGVPELLFSCTLAWRRR